MKAIKEEGGLISEGTRRYMITLIIGVGVVI
jgi:hypothetical protein